ncbi:MAG: LytTR family transcriptional regulator [Bacteroidetes bacterium]|nr:LytTR family transcriptional regulator [Bacteroidota bacterium]
MIFVKDGTKFVRIPYQDILYLKSEGNYVSFVTTDKTILSLVTIKELEEKLPSYFMRVHRSYIVNLERMESISTEEIGIGKHHIPHQPKYRPI